MLDSLQPIMNYLHQNPRLGVLIAFLIAFAESLPIIGTLIPGSVTMTAVGALIGTGLLPGYKTFGYASLGALAGDTVGFLVGYLFTEKIPKLWPLNRHPQWLQLSKRFFEKHGGKSILIGRFVGPARSTVPLVAGLFRISWIRFFLAAIPSALLWALLYMTPGILLGALALELPPHVTTEFILTGLVVIVLLWLLLWILQYFSSQFAHWINGLIDHFWDLLIRHKMSRSFIRLIAVKNKPEDHYQLTLVLLAFLSALSFCCLLYAVYENSVFTHLNKPLFFLLQSCRTQFFDHFFIVMTCLGKPVCMLLISLFVSLGLMLVRQWRAAFSLLALSVSTAAALLFFKNLFFNPRPTGFHVVAPDSSFPSGHTGMSFVVLSALAYFSGKLVRPKYKWVPYSGAITLILCIALSRLYLGAHWFTDILGGLTLGFVLLFIILMNYRRQAGGQFKKISPAYWWSLVFFSIVIPSGFWIHRDYQILTYNSSPYWPVVLVNKKTWWEHPTDYLPLYRLNRFGKPIQPFNLQWAAPLAQIEKDLTNSGWTLIEAKYTVKDTLKRIAKPPSYFSLPLLPWLYHHKPPLVIFIKALNGNGNGKNSPSYIELRLWASGICFTDSKTPLWIGTLNYHLPVNKKLGFSQFKKISLAETGGINDLVARLKELKHYQFKILQISDENQPKKIKPLHWHGKIIVIKDTRT